MTLFLFEFQCTFWNFSVFKITGITGIFKCHRPNKYRSKVIKFAGNLRHELKRKFNSRWPLLRGGGGWSAYP